jgi:hypothetical protein
MVSTKVRIEIAHVRERAVSKISIAELELLSLSEGS